jgi:hypothetical protein
MSLYFNIITRKNIEHPDQPNLYYPALKRIGMMKQSDIAQSASIGTTMNPYEIEMSLALANNCYINSLLNGYSVELGELGWLYLTSEGNGKTSPDQLSAFDITKINLHIKPSAETFRKLKHATFIPVKRIIGK